MKKVEINSNINDTSPGVNGISAIFIAKIGAIAGSIFGGFYQ